MNKKLYILAILGLLCLSCSKESTEVNIPVGFSTSIDMPTKVERYFEPGEILGLCGYNLNNGNSWDGSAYSPDFMYNYPLLHTGSENWTTEKIYYWSPNPENRKRFYAYYPYSENGSSENLKLSPQNHSGSPYIDYTVSDCKTDFIVCDAREGNVENPTIQFTARHALAKVTFSFATDLEQGMAYLKVQKICGLFKSGRFTFDATSGNGFENSTERFDLELPQPASGEVFISSNVPVPVDEYTLYLLPPNNNDGKGGLTKLETVINGKHKDFDLTTVPLASGKNTNIKIIINQKEITFTATVGDWETGGTVNETID